MRLFHFTNLMEEFAMVPWICEREFTDVARCIASDQISSWKIAQEKLLVWRVRQGRRLQDIFELTLSVLIDMIGLNESREWNLQMAIHSSSLTVVRFVSLLTEGSSKDKIEGKSVLELAKNIDIPEWIVDLRHEIVHNRLPSAGLVKKALIFAKLYICEKFWSLEVNTGGGVPADRSRDKIRTTLRAMDLTSKEKTKQLHDLLSQHRYPCPKTAVEEIAEYLLEVLKNRPITDVGLFRLSSETLTLVTPIFDSLRKCGLFDQLTGELTARIELSEDNECQRCAVWILHIISGFYSRQVDRDRVANDVLRGFLLHPTLTSSVDRLLTLLNVNKTRINELTNIVSGSSNSQRRLHTPSTTDQKIYSLADVRGHQTPEQECRESQSEDGVWRRASEMDWSNTPLGMTPYDSELAVDSSSTLELCNLMGCDNIAAEAHEDENSLYSSQTLLWSENEMHKLKANIGPI